MNLYICYNARCDTVTDCDRYPDSPPKCHDNVTKMLPLRGWDLSESVTITQTHATAIQTHFYTGTYVTLIPINIKIIYICTDDYLKIEFTKRAA